MTTSRFSQSFVFLSVMALLLGGLAACDDMSSQSVQSFVEPSYPQLSQIEPPPLKIEQRPIVEDPIHNVWRDGYWSYNGSSYDWVDGDVIPRPAPTAVWTSSVWQQRQYGWALIPGYWQ